MARSKYMKVITMTNDELASFKLANSYLSENTILASPLATDPLDRLIIGTNGPVGDGVRVNDVSDSTIVVDSLISTSTTSALSANQGKALNESKSDINHDHDLDYEPINTNIQSHISSTLNPHSVTKAQVGLSNVDNTSDINKPIPTSVQDELNLKSPLASPLFTGSIGVNSTPSEQAVLDISSTTKGILFPRMTKAQRLLITPIEGLEVYQIDSGPGKYIYSNGAWVQISGFDYALFRPNSDQSSVSANTIVSWSLSSGNMSLISNGVTLEGGKTYMVEHDQALLLSTSSDITFAICDDLGNTLANQSYSRMTSVTSATHSAINSSGQMLFTPAVDTIIKIKCQTISSGTCTVKQDGSYFKITQLA